jgi:DNA topoisomerase-2
MLISSMVIVLECIQVEPKYFIPVIPFLLVNGAQGIGTGWSTKVPPYNLPDIIEHIEMKVRGVAVREHSIIL